MKVSVERIEGTIARFSEQLANNVGADYPAPMPQEAVESFTQEVVQEEAHKLVESKGDMLNKELNATLDDNCQIIFEDLGRRNKSQGAAVERRLQTGLKDGFATQMRDIQTTLRCFTVEAQSVISGLQSAGGPRRPRSVSFKAGSAIVAAGSPGDGPGGGGNGDDGDE